MLGGKADMAVPLVVGYSGSHYEGLVPATEEDVVRCMELVENYKKGTYTVTDQDIPAFQATLTSSNASSKESDLSSEAEIQRLKGIKPKNRTKEESKRLKHLKEERQNRRDRDGTGGAGGACATP